MNLMRDKTRIVVRGLTKRYPGGVTAVDDVSFEMPGGEVLALVGPSGCGKTTTLRIIAGLEREYEAGEVWFNDERMDDVPVAERNVGIVFQHYALFPNMTVAQNVGFGLKIRNVSREARAVRVKEVLLLMRIEQLADRKISEISGGQRQRVALARALAFDPAVLLLDEPLTALDAKLREELRVELNRLLNEVGITAIVVTHDQVEAMALGHRIAIMSEGRIVQIGTPVEIYKHPKNIFVATFIGTMNVMQGNVRVRDGDQRVFVPAGSTAAIPLRANFPAGESERVTMLVRPEGIRIADGDRAAFTAVTKSVIFLGTYTRVLCEIEGGTELIVDTERTDIERDARISLTVDPQKAMRAET